jgi:phosphoglycerate dehydrogenase-like enzyme
MGRTLGIVGLGRIGKAVATRAAGLGLKLMAYELYPDTDFVERWQIQLVGLNALLESADIVSLHIPMSEDSHHMINAGTLARMRPGSILINTARGKLVDEQALCDALQSGHLQGAGLDVFDVEPLPHDSPLIGLSNVLLAGHVAGLDVESHNDTFSMAARTVLALHAGEWPADCIQNFQDRDDWTWDRDR